MKEKKNLLVIISTSDRNKILTALMYARNTHKYDWMGEVRVIFFGPAQQVLVDDAEIAAETDEMIPMVEPIACKFISDRDSLSEKTAEIGVRVEYVGKIIADYVNQGFVPMVW
ncbi:MAG: hypothetical protein GF411_06275 [Candidatus Lokiarchaeota archaeon]|nr:hypothetical protein [Candidatus Lokiarchaeota archaeon]